MYQSILINIDEVWLKGKNRRFYLKKLKDNLANAIFSQHPGAAEIIEEGPKFTATSSEGFNEDVLAAISRTAGVSSLQPCLAAPLDINQIAEAALTELRYLEKNSQQSPKTLRVETRRTNKKFPLSSMEITKAVSRHLFINSQGMSGQMKNPDVTVSVRILNEQAFVSTRKIIAVGGLPVGTSGQLVTLLSGGFDSPVASYLMFRRGVKQNLTFFHASPYVGEEPKDKVKRLAQVLALYQPQTTFSIIPFGPLQKKISELCKEDYRTLFFRIYMLKTAEKLAERINAQGLITGDSLSQVSSQTMTNIAAADACIEMPILRPLIGFNKKEIIDRARLAGTHDISAEPHDDACALFAPKHPIIRAHKGHCLSFCQEHSFLEEINQALACAEVFKINQRGEFAKTPAERKNEQDFLSWS